MINNSENKAVNSQLGCSSIVNANPENIRPICIPDISSLHAISFTSVMFVLLVMGYDFRSSGDSQMLPITSHKVRSTKSRLESDKPHLLRPKNLYSDSHHFISYSS